MPPLIHPTAVVSADARLAPDVTVGPLAVIDGPVELGPGCTVAAQARLTGPLTVGPNNLFDTGCVIGGAPQHSAYAGDPTRVEIGTGNTFREHVTVHRAMPVGAGLSPTRVTGGIDPPLHIITAYATAQIQVGDAPPVSFSGVHARILSELAALGGPAGWEVVAREVWPDEDDAWVLRKRWDVNLGRLRARLRDGGIRTDLVRAAGTGQVELVLRHNDVLEDRG